MELALETLAKHAKIVAASKLMFLTDSVEAQSLIKPATVVRCESNVLLQILADQQIAAAPRAFRSIGV